jgi:hypothetical protein
VGQAVPHDVGQALAAILIQRAAEIVQGRAPLQGVGPEDLALLSEIENVEGDKIHCRKIPSGARLAAANRAAKPKFRKGEQTA